MISCQELEHYLNDQMQVALFKDYGPNGLQVQGRASVSRLILGVTASRDLIDVAIERGADAILVHHGLFWRGQDGCVRGWMKERLQRLLTHDINLLAYHLPLDAHADFGNNAAWARRLGLEVQGRFGESNLGFWGQASEGGPVQLSDWSQHVAARMQRSPLVLPGDGRPIRRVAWCSGGAQSYFEAAIAAGADLYLSGEVSEPQQHLARETGVAYMACGHHASERYGVQDLGEHLRARWGLHCDYVDLDNPA